jgi:hypothetical protein
MMMSHEYTERVAHMSVVRIVSVAKTCAIRI